MSTFHEFVATWIFSIRFNLQLKRYQMYNLEWNGLYWITYALVDLVFNIVMTTFMTLVIYYMPEHMVFRNPQFISKPCCKINLDLLD